MLVAARFRLLHRLHLRHALERAEGRQLAAGQEDGREERRRHEPHDEHGAPQPDPAVVARYERFREAAVQVAFRDPVEIADLAIDGEDLRKAGVKPGPAMGRVLRDLLDRVIEDPALNTPAELMKLAASLAEAG